MNIQIVLRIFLAIVFGLLGYFLAGGFLRIENNELSMLIQVGIGIGAAAAGVIIVPVISAWMGHYSRVLSRRIAREVISQLRMPDFSNMRGFQSKIGSGNTKKKVKNDYQNPIVVDTSALIDGRILDVVESGFFFGTLITPDLVLAELQHIADSSNALRRGKGRRGLDILDALKKSKQIKVVIYKNGEVDGKTTDQKLLTLAKSMKAKIMTTDFNLNKVATVSGIKTLNINELVNALKTTLLPGEPLDVKIVSVGKEKNQGVGYLEDGTMIVVENGAEFLDKKIPTRVLRVLQTAAGRMIFVQAEGAEQKVDTA